MPLFGTNDNKRSVLLSPYLLLTFTYLCWAGNSVFARGAAETLPPMNLSFWRWLVTLGILLPIGLGPALAQRELYYKHWRLMLLLALFGIVGFNVLLYHAVQHTTAIQFALIVSAVPAGTVMVSWLVYRERITTVIAIGMGIAFIGVILIIGHGDVEALLNFNLNRGDLLALVAVVCWSVYSVSLKALPKNINQTGFLFVVTVIGFVFITPLYLNELLIQKRVGVLSTSNVLGVIYLGVFAGVVGFTLFNRCVKEIGANRANLFNYLLPLFTGLLAVVTLGEPVEWFHGLAIVFIFIGIYLAQRKGTDSSIR